MPGFWNDNTIILFLSTHTWHKGNLISHALVQYHFQGDELSIFGWPHGNSKKSESYVRTMPSTLEVLDNVSTQQTPKLAVHTISSQLSYMQNRQEHRQETSSKLRTRDARQTHNPLIPFSQQWWCVNKQWRVLCETWWGLQTTWLS